jgi:beta-N-acetylhexosaminidase
MAGEAARSAGEAGVGELFILGFQGPKVPAWVEAFAARFGLGGVILFDYDCQTRTYENNVRSPEQVRELCAAIAALPSAPLVYVDQEGGKVRRLKESRGFAPLPSQKQLAGLGAAEREVIWARSLAEQRALGIDVDLAPVIDLDVNPANPDIGAIERSYGADVATVRAAARGLIAAATAAGLGTCLKHYPGLGGATVNSHEALTDLTGTISAEQLALFAELAPLVPGRLVLVSHGIVADWDPERPVSMSPAGLARLRAALPDALLISDDLQMQGLQAKLPTRAAVAAGIAAGLDVLCIGNNLKREEIDLAQVASELAAAAQRDGALAARVAEARGRVTALKRTLRA